MRPKAQLAFTLLGSAALIGTAVGAAPVLEGGQKFSMTLTDEAEVPGPGDPNASGTADITINPGQRRVCWEITTSGVNPAYVIAAGSGAHIHEGDATVAGDVVVPLALTLNGTNTGCTTVSRELIDEIRKSPDQFYVNVHWRHPTDPLQNFSAGALRAQLSKAPLKSN
jgi:hypothetical protein